MVEDYLGCRAYASFDIYAINQGPTVDLGLDTVLCIGETLVLDAGAGNTYLWSDNSTAQTLSVTVAAVSYTHLRAHETVLDLVCRLLLEKKKNTHSHEFHCL